MTNSKETKSLIGLHSPNIGIDYFCVGYVIDFDETFIILQHVTKYGVKDGVHIDQIPKLERVEAESAYIKSAQILFENQDLLPKQTIKKSAFPFTDSWQYDFFNGNSCIGELIAFELSGENLFSYGFLIDFDQENFIVHLVGESGESQGTNVYHIDDIASFGLDTLQCRKRRLMYETRKMNGG